ncbi:MAG: hypothetical protein ACR2OZ_14805 [Verrucomicrobiales bacterium]
MRPPLLPFACALAVVWMLVSAGKTPTYLISFHEEGSAEDGAKRVKSFEVQGETRYFKTSPTLTQNNIKSYWPFPSQDGQTWGAMFWLDESGGKALQRIGAANRGQLITAAIDRVPVDILYVDAQPPDARIVIWKGLGPSLFKRIDQQKKIKRLANPSSTLAANPAPAAIKGARQSVAAIINAATADLPLPANPKKPRRAAPATPPRSEAKLPELPAPALPEELPFQPDPKVEKPQVVPLPGPRPNQ